MKSKGTLFDTGISKALSSGLSIILAVAGVTFASISPAQAKFLNGRIESVDIQNAPSDTTNAIAPLAIPEPEPATSRGAQPGAGGSFRWEPDGSSNSTNGAPAVSSTSQPAASKASVPDQAQLSNGIPQFDSSRSSGSFDHSDGTNSAGVPAAQLVRQNPVLAYGRSPSQQQFIPPNSFPKGFSGKWQCITRVVDSGVNSVSVGTELVSEVDFLELPDGRVLARWQQPGWTETQASTMSWSSHEAQVDRTNYYFADGYNGAWASRSRDHFIQLNPDRMECKSYVDQYIDGRYLGRYRTISVLTRMGTTSSIALGSEKER